MAQDIGVKQLNLGYNPEQDRLLLKIGMSNGSEIVAWVTYRIARDLWVGLNADYNVPNNRPIKVDDNIPEQAVKQFKQEVKAVEALQKLDFVTEYQSREVMPELKQGPLLITSVAITEQGNQLVLNMGCIGGFNIGLNLNAESILAICNMLQLTCKEAQWLIGASAETGVSIVMAGNQDKQILH